MGQETTTPPSDGQEQKKSLIKGEVFKSLNTNDKKLIYDGALKLASAWISASATGATAYTRALTLCIGSKYPNAVNRAIFITAAYKFARDLQLLSFKSENDEVSDEISATDSESNIDVGQEQTVVNVTTPPAS